MTIKEQKLIKVVYKVIVLIILYYQDISVATIYTIKEVDFGIASDVKGITGVNNAGQVIGWCRDSEGVTRSFLWENGTVTEIDHGEQGIDVSTHAINNLGQVVGGKLFWEGSTGYSRAFLWTKEGGTTYILPDTDCFARCINDRGDIIISAFSYSWYLLEGGPSIPVSSVGYGALQEINNDSVIAGCSSNAYGTCTAKTYCCPVWNSEEGYWEWNVQILSPPHSVAYGINDSGQVVGAHSVEGAVLWSEGEVIILGSGEARAINNSGQIVGHSSTYPLPRDPFLWENGSMYNLNDLVVNRGDWILQCVWNISDTGYIIGDGLLNGHNALFLLSPFILGECDFDADGDVDVLDLKTFCLHWLEENCNDPNWCRGTDLNQSTHVDFGDFAIISRQWSPPSVPDLCPDDPNKIEPGYCGCGVPDIDVDSNGIPDCGFRYGDVDGNGEVTAYDAALASQCLETLTDIQRFAADVDGNSCIFSVDADLIADYAVGLITVFPVEQMNPKPTTVPTCGCP